MFDDPKKELKRLEEQLLAAEMHDDEFERFYDEIYAEFGQQEPVREEELYGILNDTPVTPSYGFHAAPASLEQQPRPVRNYANGYGQEAVPQQPRRQPVHPQPTYPQQAAPRQTYPAGDFAGVPLLDDDRFVEVKPKQKSLRGLVILACAECIGIAAVVIYWIIRFML